MKKVVLDEYIRENKAEFMRIRLRMTRGIVRFLLSGIYDSGFQ